MIGYVRDFLFAQYSIWTGDFWISNPTLYHCVRMTFGFPFWQLQVFNSGAEGLVMVLFWLDLWEIFVLPTMGFELGTYGSHILHSTTVLEWLLFFTSNNLRYLTLVQRTSGGNVLIRPVRDFLFAHNGIWTGDLWILHPAIYHCAMVTSVFHL